MCFVGGSRLADIERDVFALYVKGVGVKQGCQQQRMIFCNIVNRRHDPRSEIKYSKKHQPSRSFITGGRGRRYIIDLHQMKAVMRPSISATPIVCVALSCSVARTCAAIIRYSRIEKSIFESLTEIARALFLSYW